MLDRAAVDATLYAVARFLREEISGGKLAEVLGVPRSCDALRAVIYAAPAGGFLTCALCPAKMRATDAFEVFDGTTTAVHPDTGVEECAPVLLLVCFECAAKRLAAR